MTGNRNLIRGDAVDQLCEDNGVSSKSSTYKILCWSLSPDLSLIR